MNNESFNSLVSMHKNESALDNVDTSVGDAKQREQEKHLATFSAIFNNDPEALKQAEAMPD